MTIILSLYYHDYDDNCDGDCDDDTLVVVIVVMMVEKKNRFNSEENLVKSILQVSLIKVIWQVSLIK